MATQNNIAISPQLFAAENATLTVVSEKERKKQREEMAHMAAALQAVTTAVASAKAGVESAAATGDKGKVVTLNPSAPSQGGQPMSFEAAMNMFAKMLGELQVLIAKYGQDKASMDAINLQSQVAMVQQQVKDIQAQMEKIDAANKKQQEIQTAEKVVSWIIAIASGIAACLTFQPELFIMTALAVASATGAMSFVTQKIASGLEDLGMSKEAANVLAAAIVVVVVIAATFGAGALTAAPEVVADEAMEDGIEMADMSADAAADGGGAAAADTSSEASSILQKVGQFLAKNNPFALLGKTANMTILAAAQSIASTGLITNIADAIMVAEKTPEAKRKQIEMWISMAVEIASIVVSLGASAGAMVNATTKIASEVSTLSMKLASFSQVVYKLGNAAQAVTGVVEGGVSIYQGFNEKELANINAAMILIRNSIDMNSSQTQMDQKNTAEQVKNQKQDGQTIAHLMDGEAAIARALCSQA